MIKNCTPHRITLRPDDGAEIIVEPSGIVPRVAVAQSQIGQIEGVPVVATTYGQVEGLPDFNEGVTLIVSGLVLSALGGQRPDCVAPDTSPAGAIRNEAGQIIAVRRLTK